MPISMPFRPQTPQANAEPQGDDEFARVLSLVEHFQKCAGQHVLALDSDLGTPTPTSAATSASCKKASGAASRSRGDSNCSKQLPGSKPRRYRSNSGISRARLASISSPGRASATSVDPANVSVERSIKSLQKKILHHMGGTGRKSNDSSYDSSYDSTSRGSNIINLAVDCTTNVDVPTRTSGCIPAVYGCAGQGLDGRPELGIDPVNEWTLDSTSSTSSTSSSSSSSSSSEGDPPQSDDAVTAALWERVQQLEQSNRLLEQQMQQLQAEMTQQQEQQKQHDEQSQGGVMCQIQDMQLKVCLLPVVSIVADCQSLGATSEAAAPAAAVAECSDASSSSSSSSSCYVIEAPPSPVAVSWLAEDEAQQQQQQQQQDDEHVGITIDALPASSLSNQQQQQDEEEDLVDPLKSQPPHAHYSTKPSYHGSKSCPGFPAATTGQQQQLLLEEEEQYVSMILSLQREVARLQMLQQLQQTDYEDLEFVLKDTEKQRRDYAARYAFVVLDQDNDGYISTDQVERYELFATYAPEVLARAFQQWRWQSGFPGYLNMEDFVRFVAYADDRSTCTSQRFWFNVLDTDGDGYLGWQDMRQAYEAVDKSSAAYIIGFEDLMNQIRDMVELQQHPELGFTCSELCGSRLGAGVIALLTNHNNMLLQRSTAEWGRGDFPL